MTGKKKKQCLHKDDIIESLQGKDSHTGSYASCEELLVMKNRNTDWDKGHFDTPHLFIFSF